MTNTTSIARALNALEQHAYPHMLECERRFIDECRAGWNRKHFAGIRALLGRYRDVVPNAEHIMQALAS